MCKQALDTYDFYRPIAMSRYLSFRGWHFDKKTCDYAVSLMKKKNPATGRLEPIEPMSKDQVDELLAKHGVKLENNTLYDYVYVANMARADFYKSSLPDDKSLALFVKDSVDDPDAADGTIMRRWYATMVANGCGVEWSDFL